MKIKLSELVFHKERLSAAIDELNTESSRIMKAEEDDTVKLNQKKIAERINGTLMKLDAVKSWIDGIYEEIELQIKS